MDKLLFVWWKSKFSLFSTWVLNHLFGWKQFVFAALFFLWSYIFIFSIDGEEKNKTCDSFFSRPSSVTQRRGCCPAASAVFFRVDLERGDQTLAEWAANHPEGRRALNHGWHDFWQVWLRGEEWERFLHKGTAENLNTDSYIIHSQWGRWPFWEISAVYFAMSMSNILLNCTPPVQVCLQEFPILSHLMQNKLLPQMLSLLHPGCEKYGR